MPEKILLPLDGSKIGEAAVPYVEDLLSKLSLKVKTEVTLLRVIASQTHYVMAGETGARVPYTEKEMEQIKKEAANYLNKTGKGLRSKNVVVKIRVAVGNPAEEIIKAADEINADLIAMSTHGRSGIRRWAFGSVTDRVLRGGNKPILMVRAPREAMKT